MVFCTCLCLKKNATQSMNYSFTLCRRMISSSISQRTAHLYSNASAPLSLLRGNTITSPSYLNASPRLRHEFSQYPASLFDPSSRRQWRFMSVKRSEKVPSDKVQRLNYETNDATPIERLTSPAPQIQHCIQQSANLASKPPSSPATTTSHFDTTAFNDFVKNGRLRDALRLVLHPESTHKGILDYSPKDRRLFFTKLGCLSSSEITTLLEPWMQQQQQQTDLVYNKHLKQLLKCLGSNLPMDLIDSLVRRYPLDLSLQTALFQRLVKSYMDGGAMQIDDMMDYLDPLSNSNMKNTSNTIRTRLYNTALNGCLKMGRWDHVDKVLACMASSGCTLDAASYNMLIRSRLDNGDTVSANALYEQLTDSSVATTATFNTFIKYACQQHMWNEMTLWLDRLLEQPDQQPNPVTLRILTAALTEHIDQPAVLDAFERVAKLVPVTSLELEATVNTSIVHLLRHKHTDLALTLLYKLFDRPATKEPYQLTVNTYNIFIHALTQKGDMEAADRVLVSMRDQQHSDNSTSILPLPDIVSYTTLIHGYVRSANANDVDIERISTLYKELMDRGLETNAVLQSVVLYAMVKSGFEDIKECSKLFESLVEEDDEVTALRNGHTLGKPQWNFDSSRQRGMDPKMSRMTMYNMMMDGYFLHQQYERKQQQLTSANINRTHRHIPPESLALLNRAIEKGLPLTTATLNIWIRGLALFNHDLQAAESMVKWISLNHGVEMNERTIYYLVRTALAQGRRDKARKWISFYEGMDRTIQGTGLLYFKDMVTKS